jgi:predicted permease
MTGLADDLTTALRQIRRQPGFALVVVLTLGSAMGISTALFSIGDRSWSREWPVPQADRIVAGWMHLSVAEVRYWADHSTTFEGMAAHQIGFSKHRIEGRRVFYDFVTTNYFDVLRVPIVLGRRFADTDEHLAGAEPEAVISYRTWEERFDRDPGIIGKRVPLGSSPFTISGVAAPGFEGGGTPLRRHLWFSLSAREALQIARAPMTDPEKRPREVRMFGRLAQGVGITRANAELLALSERFWAERGLKAERVSLQGADTASQSPKSAQETATYYTMLLAIAFLCMIACANVSNLFLARGHARRGEIAVRLSLGASRPQLVRQLLVEALLLSLSAGVLGIAFASLLPAHFLRSAPDVWEMVRIGFHLDARVFGWALLLSTLACAVFGLAPALRVTGLRASEILKDTNGQSSPSLRTSLTSMQAFVSVMALGIAGLVVRSDTVVQGRALAQRMEGLVMVRPVLPKEYDAARVKVARARLFENLRGVASSEQIAAVREDPHLPVIGERADLAVSHGYFTVMGLSFLAGRAFDSTDPADRVAVISETLARTLWPGGNALGKSLVARLATATPREVIGVVRDASPGELASYAPIAAADLNLFLVRDSESRFRGRAAGIARSVDPNLQLDITGGELWLTQTSPGAVLTTRLFGEFGAFALALTAVGLFSLSEYLVRQRTREIGIRTALGARPRHILSTILKPATRSLASGLAAGTLAAILSGFLMRRWGLPTGVHPLDTTNYAVVGLLMVGAGVLAMGRPAIKAMRVEPSEALRYE